MTLDTKKEVQYWYTDFYDNDKESFNKIWVSGKNNAEAKKIAEGYKRLKTFESKLNKKYRLYTSLADLYKNSFLDNQYDNAPIKLVLKFKRMETQSAFINYDEKEPSDLLHLIFADNSGLEIATIPEEQNKDKLPDFKPGNTYYVYGLGSKNLVGELRLIYVRIYGFEK